MSTGFKFLDGGVQKDFADIFNITNPVPGVTTGYKSYVGSYAGKDLGEIFTAGTGSGKTTNYKYSTNIDLGSIFTLKKSWSALGSGIDGTPVQVWTIAISGSNVYIGGQFTTAGGVSAKSIAVWNGTTWSALGTGITSAYPTVNSIAISGSNVYVGGYFTSAGGVSVSNIAVWNTSLLAWSALGNGVYGTTSAQVPTVNSIAISGSNVYVGGSFSSAGTISGVNNIAVWNGSTWSALGGGGVTGTTYPAVYSIAISGSNIYTGGQFTTAGITSGVNNIAVWNSGVWSALGTGITSSGQLIVDTIAISGSNVYVGGEFTTAGGITGVNNIAVWNTSSVAWSALGTGVTGGSPSVVQTIAISNGNVYVGGQFTIAGGISASNIALFSGTTWNNIGNIANVLSLAIDNIKVYTGGTFTTAGGVSAKNIAYYN